MDHREQANWSLIFFDFSPKYASLYEELCTLGNGYFLSKGVCWKPQGENFPPCSAFILKNCTPLQAISISTRLNDALVEIPEWSGINFRIDGGKWFNIQDVKIGSIQQELDLRSGVLYREIDFTDENQRHSILLEKRFIHRTMKHFGCLKWSIKSLNWSGDLEVCSDLGYYHKPEEQRSMVIGEGTFIDDSIATVFVESQDSVDRACIATQTKILSFEENTFSIRQEQTSLNLRQVFSFAMSQEKRVQIEKICAVNCNKYVDKDQLSNETVDLLHNRPSFDSLLASHIEAYQSTWNQIYLDIQSEEHPQGFHPMLLARLQLFRLLQMGGIISSHDLQVARDIY